MLYRLVNWAVAAYSALAAAVWGLLIFGVSEGSHGMDSYGLLGYMVCEQPDANNWWTWGRVAAFYPDRFWASVLYWGAGVVGIVLILWPRMGRRRAFVAR